MTLAKLLVQSSLETSSGTAATCWPQHRQALSFVVIATILKVYHKWQWYWKNQIFLLLTFVAKRLWKENFCWPFCWRTRGHRAASWTESWWFGLMASWIWVNSVPWQQKGPTESWGTSSTAQPAGCRRWLSHPTLHSCSTASSAACSFGCLKIRKTPNY